MTQLLRTVLDVLALAGAGASFLLAAFAVFLAQAEPDQRRRALTRVAAVLRCCRRWAANLLLLAWVLVSWRRVTRNLGLAYADKHAIRRVRKVDDKGVTTERERPKVAYPWLFARPDAYGVVLTVWTRARIGRAAFEDVADHLADTWRCRRVHVEQRKPGRITVRALRRDPLDARLSLDVPEAPVLHLVPEGGVPDGEHHSPTHAA